MITPKFRLVSVLISHFFLNLRQAANSPRDQLLGTGASWTRSHSTTLRFASFIDGMGEQLDEGLGPSDAGSNEALARADEVELEQI